jgi:enduracididine biosynthesis enzyme MppP
MNPATTGTWQRTQRCNLTDLELSAVDYRFNLSDGHARHDLTATQQLIVDALPELFADAAAASPAQLDLQAQASFLGALGQFSATDHTEILSCYSSSVAMEILARSLHLAGMDRIGVLHPTFDNIPDILRGCGVTPVPVDEDAAFDGQPVIPADADAVLLTTPNNPTGRVLAADQLARWGQAAVEAGALLVLDTSFRGFDTRAQYDHYAVLADVGAQFAIIEDTGKLWPTLDLKVGFLAVSPGLPLPVRRIHTDILLGVSPLILLLVKEFSAEAAAGGWARLHATIEGNRNLLRSQLATAGIEPTDLDSRISVERIELPPHRSASDVWQDLLAEGVGVLPCAQFHWADQPAGERFLRVALARRADVVAEAAARIARHLGRAD